MDIKNSYSYLPHHILSTRSALLSVGDKKLLPISRRRLHLRWWAVLIVRALDADVVHFDELVDLHALLRQLFATQLHHVLQLVLVRGQLGQDIFDGASTQHAADQPVATSRLVHRLQCVDDRPVHKTSMV